MMRSIWRPRYSVNIGENHVGKRFTLLWVPMDEEWK